MKCIISGLETNNKYKNQPIHPDVSDLAKELMQEKGMSMSEAFKIVAYMLHSDIKERLNVGANSTGTTATIISEKV